MKKIAILVMAAACLALSAAPIPAALVKQFALGVRWKHFELTGDKSFTGTVTADTVEERQEWHPTNFNMLWVICPYGGISLEYDRFGANMERDGRLFWDTFTLGVNVRHEFKKYHVAPYGLVGATYNTPSFDENNWWRYGWSSVAEYDRHMAAKPADVSVEDWQRSGRVRNMETDKAWGVAAGVGLDYFVWKDLALNAEVRWNHARTDVRYTIMADGGDHENLTTRDFGYDLDTVSYSLGLRWYF